MLALVLVLGLLVWGHDAQGTVELPSLKILVKPAPVFSHVTLFAAIAKALRARDHELRWILSHQVLLTKAGTLRGAHAVSSPTLKPALCPEAASGCMLVKALQWHPLCVQYTGVQEDDFYR